MQVAPTPDGGIAITRENPVESKTEWLTKEEAFAMGIMDEGEIHLTEEELKAREKKIGEEFEEQLAAEDAALHSP